VWVGVGNDGANILND